MMTEVLLMGGPENGTTIEFEKVPGQVSMPQGIYNIHYVVLRGNSYFIGVYEGPVSADVRGLNEALILRDRLLRAENERLKWENAQLRSHLGRVFLDCD